MIANLFLEAFGHLTPGTAVIMATEEDLYSVFRERSELMGWSTTDITHRPLFWDMLAAELTDGNPSGRIGWVQVVLASRVIGMGPMRPPSTPAGWAAWPEIRRPEVEPAQVLPALCQCLVDALRRFGDVTIEGLQLTVSALEPCTLYRMPDISGHSWFNLTPRTRTTAIVAFDQAWLGDPATHDLVARLQRQHTGSCVFGPVVRVPEPRRIAIPVEAPALPALEPAERGVIVRLPEWTASAVGWVLAFVIDTVRTLAPGCPPWGPCA